MGATDGHNSLLKYKKQDPSRPYLKVGDPYFYENHQDVNFFFVNITTPANFFHVLRRQQFLDYRKPMIIAGPKMILRDPMCRSSLSEFAPGTTFQPILKHYAGKSSPKKAKLALFCSGRYVYHLKKHLEESHKDKLKQISLVTIEELLPFPEEILSKHLSGYNKNAKVLWMQDESFNTGAYSYVAPRFSRMLKEQGFKD
jgi:2-oxoglutarate dehydrogenase complex dehydrogenase (E1) component-like enzyme